MRGLVDHGRQTHIDFHLLVKAIIHDQAVCHSYAMRLHGMSSIISVISNIRVVKVGDLLCLSTIDAWGIEWCIALGARSHVGGR